MAKKIIVAAVLLGIVFTLAPVPVQAAPSLVPCGRSDQAGTEKAQCTFQDLIILIVRLINYLISTAAIVAMYHVLLSGWNLITAMGSAEKVTAGKQGITHAAVGFAMVVLAFVFVNLLINGLFGRPNTQRQWWDINCLYNINGTTNTECPISSEGQ